MQSNWQSFLKQQSANIDNNLVCDFGDPAKEREHAKDDNIMSDLSQLDVLLITGEDATEFLHGQFSSDVSALAVNEVQTSAWCNIKGRVIVSFLLYRSHDGYYLLLEREMTELVLKRLQMFVLRSRVNISNQSSELIRIGLRGESVDKQLRQYLSTESTDTSLISLPLPDSLTRSIILSPFDQAKALWQQLSDQAFSVGSKYWSMYDILAGIAWVGKAGSEEFLPQSLNLDLTGGLSFDKGCYPGQEIIARMHFRGKLKQRLFLLQVSVSEAPEIKTKLYLADVSQHVGMVVNTTMQSNDSCLMLVILDLEHSNKTPVHLDSVDGPAMETLSLPYSTDT